MKKFFKYNRPVAIVSLVLIIFLSIWLGGLKSVNSLKKNVIKTYSVSGSTYVCAAEDISKYISYAEQLLGIAEANGVESKDFRSSLEELKESKSSPFDSARPYEKNKSAASVVYNTLYAKLYADESGRDTLNSLIGFYHEMVSVTQRLSENSRYNKAAKKFNSASLSFPASLFCGSDTAVVFG